MAGIRRFDVVAVGGRSADRAARFAAREGRSVALVEGRAGAFPPSVRPAPSQGELPTSITPFFGHARFVDRCLLELDDGTRVHGDAVLLAPGARPRIPPIRGLDDGSFWTSDTVIEQQTQPRRLLIIGGGYVGCEFGHFFAALGTRVTLVERDTLLKLEDDDVRRFFAHRFGEHVEVLTGAEVRAVTPRRGHHREVAIAHPGGDLTRVCDAILVAAGRKPNTDGLMLHRTGVEVDEQGHVLVDERLATTCPGIFAFGEVIGRALSKHPCGNEARIAWENACGADHRIPYRSCPHAVFASPEIGSVGLTESECAARGLDHVTLCSDWFHDDVEVGERGFAKLIVEPPSRRILGLHVVGPYAARLIHELVAVAHEGDERVDAAGERVRAHPTLPRSIGRLFDAAAAESTRA